MTEQSMTEQPTTEQPTTEQPTTEQPMKLRARIPAPVAEVMHALTDATALRSWLAEHAEVDLPHRYEFWGRYTPEGDAPHQTLRHVDDRTLRFDWLLDGVETEVEITLTPDGGETILDLSQSHWSFDYVTEGTSIRGVLQTYWVLSIANLADHVAGRTLTDKIDFTSVRMSATVMIDASPAQVYDSLVDADKFSEWFGYPVEMEPREGGRFAMGGFENNPHPATFRELVPGERASIDFGGMVASWELADSGGRTRMTFVQSGFDESNPPYAAWGGWLSGVAELRRYHELARWRPLWIEPANA